MVKPKVKRQACEPAATNKPGERDLGCLLDLIGCLIESVGCFFTAAIVILSVGGTCVTCVHILTWLGRR